MAMTSADGDPEAGLGEAVTTTVWKFGRSLLMNVQAGNGKSRLEAHHVCRALPEEKSRCTPSLVILIKHYMTTKVTKNTALNAHT